MRQKALTGSHKRSRNGSRVIEDNDDSNQKPTLMEDEVAEREGDDSKEQDDEDAEDENDEGEDEGSDDRSREDMDEQEETAAAQEDGRNNERADVTVTCVTVAEAANAITADIDGPLYLLHVSRRSNIIPRKLSLCHFDSLILFL